jgi:hypothetical protein
MAKTKLGVGGKKKAKTASELLAVHRFHWTDDEIDAFTDLVGRIGLRVLTSQSFIQAIQLVRSFTTLTG